MRDGPGAEDHGSPITGHGAPVRIWDLPTRLFHWTLASLIVVSLVTAKLGSGWLEWHMRAGYAILALVLFRILWGFAGSRYARFATFVRGPSTVLGYLRGSIKHVGGHNPLGGLSVVVLLLALTVQASTGLFTNDGSFTEGPLAKLASSDMVDLLSSIHRFGEWLIYSLVALHVAAVFYYVAFRFEPLISAMLTGDREDIRATPVQDDRPLRLRALVLAVLCALLVTYLVTL